jgi:hypothetical protein
MSLRIRFRLRQTCIICVDPNIKTKLYTARIYSLYSQQREQLCFIIKQFNKNRPAIQKEPFVLFSRSHVDNEVVSDTYSSKVHHKMSPFLWHISFW